jgi:hypothetical protein
MDLFGRKAKKQVKQLEEALKDCEQKLIERQEVINRTNAYWKKKVREIKHSASNFGKKNEL